MLNFLKNKKWYILCFVVPFLFLLISYVFRDIIPFGNKSITTYDSIHQYVPFFNAYYDKIKNLDNIFYSFTGGLGYDFYSLWTYYLTSPINLIIILFKKEDIILAMTLITTIKICLCSCSCMFYLSKTFKKESFHTVVFAWCYGMSSYVLSYFINIMWLDTVILFPIVLYFMDKMIKQDKGYIKYTFLLALLIYCNFYMAISVCLFLIVYYITRDFNGIKDFFVKGIKFGLSSILSAALNGIILIPAIYSMGSNSGEAKFDFSDMENFITFFTRHFALSKPTIEMNFSSGANIYCSMAVLIFVILHVFNKKIDRERRIKDFILLFFMVMCMNCKFLNYIFHGFAYPTGYMNRFSYIYILLLITIAYSVFLNLRSYKLRHTIYLIFVLYTFILFSFIYSWVCLKNIDFSDIESYMKYIAAAAIGILYLIPLMAYLIRKRVFNGRIFRIIFCILLTIEVFGTSVYNICKTGEVDYDNYYGKSEYNYELINSIDDKYYRSDFQEPSVTNECVFYGVNGISLFSSSLNSETATQLFKFGFRGGSNYLVSEGHTPFTDILFNLKYIYGKSDEYYPYSSIYYENELDNRFSVIQSDFNTSYGYLVPTNVIYFMNWKSNNPFIIANDFCKYYLGKENDIYQRILADDIEVSSNVKDYSKTGQNNMSVEFNKEKNESGTLYFTYNMIEDRDLYVNIKSASIANCVIYVNEEIVRTVPKVNGDIIILGDLKSGDVVEVETKLKNAKTHGTVSCNMAMLNNEKFEHFADDILLNKFIVTDMTSNSMIGTIHNDSEINVLYLSIPYSKGWDIKLNGKAVEALEDYEFIFIPLEVGDNYIEMSYIPQGFDIGLKITIVSSVIFFTLIIINIFKKKRDIG